MKIGVLGTGAVGQTIGTKLVQKGHEVKLGSRTANNEKAQAWVKTNSKSVESGERSAGRASQGTFADAASFGEIVFNCTKGEISLEALKLAGAANLKGKILVDAANPLDFSKGMPPTLIPSLCNTNSLGEEIQKNYPGTKVVKALNTMNCRLMVQPTLVPGTHDLFICGNDAGAKEKISALLKNDFGWTSIIDMGDITSSRATEMLLPIWIRLMVKFGSPDFNFKIVK